MPVAQAAKPADEVKPRPVRKKTTTRRRTTSKAGLAACATGGGAADLLDFGHWILGFTALFATERGQREGHSVPGSAGIFARETPCARLVYFECASRANPSSAVREVRLLTDKGLTFFLLCFRHYIADEARAGGQAQ
ncbi:MAG: hypothetical protein LBM04_00120, partial [Opitutaceae bacterium]|nr:hypothetical protein [Opitutaceae bacterium]